MDEEDTETNGWKERRRTKKTEKQIDAKQRRWRRKTQKQNGGKREDEQGRQRNKWMEREEMEKEVKV